MKKLSHVVLIQKSEPSARLTGKITILNPKLINVIFKTDYISQVVLRISGYISDTLGRIVYFFLLPLLFNLALLIYES